MTPCPRPSPLGVGWQGSVLSREGTRSSNADGRVANERLPAMAAELVALPAAVIFAGAEPAALAAKAATSTIPIVFSIGSDPVEQGLVASYNRPGSNATGVSMFTATLGAKRLGLLHELVPQAATIGVPLNPKYSLAENQLRY